MSEYILAKNLPQCLLHLLGGFMIKIQLYFTWKVGRNRTSGKLWRDYRGLTVSSKASGRGSDVLVGGDSESALEGEADFANDYRNGWKHATGRDPNLWRASPDLEIPGTLKFLGDHYRDSKATRMPRYWDSNSPGTPMFLGDHYWDPDIPRRLVGQMTSLVLSKGTKIYLRDCSQEIHDPRRFLSSVSSKLTLKTPPSVPAYLWLPVADPPQL
jgi:hypothetical protein